MTDTLRNETKVEWRSCSQPPEPNDFGVYITWNPRTARPGAFLSFYNHRQSLWVAAGGIFLLPTHWVPFEEVFDLTRLAAP